MSKLDKRAISIFVIAILALSFVLPYVTVNAGDIPSFTLDLQDYAAGATGWYNVEFTSVAGGAGNVVLDFSAFGPTATDMDLSATDLTGVTFTGFSTDPTAVVVDNGAAKTLTFTGGTILPTAACDITGLTITNDQDAETQAVTIDILGVDTGAYDLTILPAALDYFTMTDYPGTCVAGVAWTAPVTVTASDVYGNLKTDYLGTVTWDSSDPLSALPVSYDFVSGDSGSHLFAGSEFILRTIGIKTITVSDGGVSVTSAGITVTGEVEPGLSIDYVTDTELAPVTGGIYGDKVIVFGSGVTSGAVLNLYWNYVNAAGLVNNTEAKPSGEFEVWFKVPEAVYGDHYLWVKDVGTGGTTSYGPFTVDAKLKLSPDSGLEGDKVTIKGYGFSEDADVTTITWDTEIIDTLYPTKPVTDDLGSWTATFKVPVQTSNPHTVYAQDEIGIYADDQFDIGASISLSPSSGPVGSIVEIRGRGFTDDPDVVWDDFVYFDGSTDIKVTAGDDIYGGEFRIKVVIPNPLDDEPGEYPIKINIPVPPGDPAPDAEIASADFEVTGVAKIETDYAFGVQGTTINIEGWNFTRISGKKVQLNLLHEEGGLHTEIPNIEEFETDSKGYFSGTFTVPARSSDKYILEATQTTYHIEGETGFRIGLMLILIHPSSGPTGTNVVLTGMGFTEDGEWNATFGGVSIIEDGEIDLDSNLGTGVAEEIPTFIVPTLDTGQYTLVVNDISDLDSIITVSIEFMVTETTTLVTDPLVAPNEYDVEIKGKYFSELPDDVVFIIYNVTADGKIDKDWDMEITSLPDPVITDDDGNFTAVWKVPESDILSVGDYWINATQENDIFAQYLFSVVEKTVEIEPRKPSFALGETVYFDIESSFAMAGSYIEIYDPYDHLYWRTDDFKADEWLKVGTIERMPYYQQTAGGNPMTLMDATVGPWFWEMFYEDDPVCNGTFEVTPAPSDILTDRINALSGELAQLADDITGVTDEIAGDIADLSSDISDVEANVQDMIDDITADLAEELAGVASDTEAAVDELEGSIGDIAAAQNALDSKLDDMGQDTAAAKQAAEDAQRTSQGVTTLVYGAIAASLIAALAAIVSLMQISKKIA